ncbi:MAG: hypothetical protein MUO26_12475 [Methanotrichaceae archaeon]|nr:hypothetical protein [Methanotrichaceae archaeon]
MFSIAMAEMVGEQGKVIAVDIQKEMLEILFLFSSWRPGF